MMSTQNQAATKHILLVEDDAGVGQMLSDVLESEGYRASHAPTGAEAKAVVERECVDLIVLDLRLPDADGLVLCADLHSRARAPIIIVSATNEKRDAILAFKLGADDFVAKPFDVDHLLARVEASLRRAGAQAPATSAPRPAAATAPPPAATVAQPDSRLKRAGSLVMDHARRQVTLDGRRVQVTPTEYRILETLIDSLSEVVTRDELAMKVWGFQDAGIGRSLDVHIRRLRLKLSQASATPPVIASVRGFGYRMDAVPETSLALAA